MNPPSKTRRTRTMPIVLASAMMLAILAPLVLFSTASADPLAHCSERRANGLWSKSCTGVRGKCVGTWSSGGGYNDDTDEEWTDWSNSDLTCASAADSAIEIAA